MENKHIQKGGQMSVEGEDRISKLPEPLLSQILSYFPTKDAVRTSILSSGWRNLWLSVPKLSLDSVEFPDYDDFVSFVDKFLVLHSGDIHCFWLRCWIHFYDDDFHDTSCFTSWVDALVKRKLQHLNLQYFNLSAGDEVVKMPLTLYTCETLVSLKLESITLDNPEFVSLPCLETMRLENVQYANDLALEMLISGCPVLNDLYIVRCDDDNVNVVSVRSQTLERFYLEYEFLKEEYDEALGVVIDAPELKYLSLKDQNSKSFVTKRMDSFPKVYIKVTFNKDYGHLLDPDNILKRKFMRKLLMGVSSAENMVISKDTFEVIYNYLALEPLPRFNDLSCLRVKFTGSSMEFLPKLLESCPNLKSLYLKCCCAQEVEQISVLDVPLRFLSSLEFVEITGEFAVGKGVGRALAWYFLQNSAVLKQLILYPGRSIITGEENTVLEELLALPRRSTTCQVSFGNRGRK